jgi:hypothetical protein
MSKTWNDIEREVEEEMLERFNSVPKEQRAKLGLEGASSTAYENRQWVQAYVQMLTWKNKCRELHEQAHPADDNNSAGVKKTKLKRIK